MTFDALLLVSFGGPEGVDDVMPFLEKVLHGRAVPPSRLTAVAAHYYELGGVSPINGQNRALQAALQQAFPDRPVYWGNRNWHPLLADTVAAMRTDGIRRAAAFVTSAYSSYSSCREYVDDLEAARRATGPGAPEVVKVRPYFDHPGFIAPFVESVVAALAASGPETPVLMTAHSIPIAMAEACDYEQQLLDVGRRVAGGAGAGEWSLVFQSRSGRPDQPWLGPDISDAIASLPDGTESVIVAPIGFVSDHMEVVYDLDRVAARAAAERGIRFIRAATPGTHPAFVSMVGDLVAEAEGAPPPCPCARGCPPARPPVAP